MGFIFGIACLIFFIGVPILIIALIMALAKPEKFNTKFKKDYSRRKIAGVGITSVLVALVTSFTAMGLTAPPVQPQSAAQSQVQSVKTETPKPVVKTETTTEGVLFETTQQQDNTLPSGQQRTAVEGVNGVRTHTYEVTYLNGIEQSRKEIKNEVTTQPITKIVKLGTYVAPAPAPVAASCPNGTYVNSTGATVCSPYASSSTPAGATAQCSDGTYSFSQSRSGTCSHHGGVTAWL